jgi:hypothetical protein
LPWVNTSYTGTGKHRAIEHYLGDLDAPPELKVLEKQIDEIVRIEQWVGTRQEWATHRYR